MILKDTGSFYLNLGDTYVGTDNCRAKSWKRPKQLALIPSRVAIALQEDGWILRNDICWIKPNGLPSSVKDRLTCRWEHVFHFVKQRKYYYELDVIREPYKECKVRGQVIYLIVIGSPDKFQWVSNRFQLLLKEFQADTARKK